MHNLILRFITAVVIPASTYYFWRRELKQEAFKRRIEERLDQVIRGY